MFVPLIERPTPWRFFGLAAALCLPLTPALGQADASRPPLIRWQRTLEDAEALAKQLKLPLLVVANQDGEPACERLVSGRYRNPRFAKLANRYVAVIASLNRHNPRDYDDQGRRIPCPRFGCVTCGEHIAIEPKIFKKFFKKNGVAPRHIGIGTDGKERFDRFLDRNLSAIDQALEDNAGSSGDVPELTTKSDSTRALVASRAHEDRVKLEARFRKASASKRASILAAVRKARVPQPELIRMGLRSGQASVAAAARRAFAVTASGNDLDLLLRSLGTARTRADYDAILQATAHAAKTDPTCARALVIRRALDAAAKGIDPALWREKFTEFAGIRVSHEIVPNEELEDLDARIEASTKAARNGDPNGKHSLAIAASTFRYALNRLQNSKDPTFLLQDAKAAAQRAAKAGASADDTSVWLARTHWLLNELDDATKHAKIAIRSIRKPKSLLGAAPTSANAAAILEIYARCQQRIVQTPSNDKKYPSAALTEAHRAWETLAYHPLVTEAQLKTWIDLLQYVGARRAAGAAILLAIGRYPASTMAHDELRKQALWEDSHKGLANAYNRVQRNPNSRAALDWYEGYACILAAEGMLSTASRSDAADSSRARVGKTADGIYERAIQLFRQSGQSNPAYQASANQYAARAYSGRAKLALDENRLTAAVDAVIGGVNLGKATYTAADGLGNTLERTSKRLRRKLRGKAALLKRLEQALAQAGVQ